MSGYKHKNIITLASKSVEFVAGAELCNTIFSPVIVIEIRLKSHPAWSIETHGDSVYLTLV